MLHKLETKASFTIDEAGLVEGVAWPYGSPDRTNDMIEPGSFKSAAFPIPMLFSHNPDLPVGVWESATETKSGFEVKGRLLIPDVAKAVEAHALLKARAITGLSIGFKTVKSFRRTDGGRTITALDLMEISLVTVPAHPGAKITSAKSLVPTDRTAFRLADEINRARRKIRGESNAYESKSD